MSVHVILAHEKFPIILIHIAGWLYWQYTYTSIKPQFSSAMIRALSLP